MFNPIAANISHLEYRGRLRPFGRRRRLCERSINPIRRIVPRQAYAEQPDWWVASTDGHRSHEPKTAMSRRMPRCTEKGTKEAEELNKKPSFTL